MTEKNSLTTAPPPSAPITDKRAISTLLWSPKTYDELKKFAEDISKSQLVPTAYKDKPGDIVVAMVRGSEIGFTPLASLDAFAVINGKACLYGDAPLALVQASGLMEWHREYDDGITWTFEAKRRGDPHPIVSTFSVDDAKKASLWGKTGPWSQYPKRMMKFRARGFGLRDKFADALKGMGIAEEMADYEVVQAIDEKTAIVQPRRASESAAAAAATMVHEKVPQAPATKDGEEIGTAELVTFIPSKVTKDKHGMVRVYNDSGECFYTEHAGIGAIAKAAQEKNTPVELSYIVDENGKKVSNLTLAE